MAFKPGDQVTVVPNELDPIVLHMQRFVTVVEDQGDVCVIEVADTYPPNERFRIESKKLLPGWRYPRTGAFRSWAV